MLMRLDYLAPPGFRRLLRAFLLLAIVSVFLSSLHSLFDISRDSYHFHTAPKDQAASPNQPGTDAESQDLIPGLGAAGDSLRDDADKFNMGRLQAGSGSGDGKSKHIQDTPIVSPADDNFLDLLRLKPKPDPKAARHHRFVLVIPASLPNTDLCKTVATALALGYPSPVIVNWELDHQTVTKWAGGATLPKIPGLLQYLDAAMQPASDLSEKLEDDDLVLMVDAYDVWFQLPAEVLLKRYHDINAKANERLRQQWPSDAEPMPMRQTIVAASSKDCNPSNPASGSDLHCDLWPESPLRTDLYGPETDKNATLHHNNRPRYLNGGLYMGPAGDMRRLFRRAQQKMEAGIGQGLHLYSEQGIPGEIFAEQEMWRQWQRKINLTAENATLLLDRDLEYHLGLDYAQELSVQTLGTDLDATKGLFDGSFITLQNQARVDAYSQVLGISPVRLHGVPEDIQSQRNPLLDLGLDVSWGSLSLYADFFLESVPAMIHHNGFKSRRKLWWEQAWFQPYLRELLTLRAKVPVALAPLAIVETASGIVNYWAPLAERQSRRPRRMDPKEPVDVPLKTLRLHELCHNTKEKERYKGRTWWDEVFRDKKGPLEI